MPLDAPDLDTRRFDDLVREARERIPRYTPEWTNFNDSDPGMTLVQLHAWMTETILYQLNRVPDLNYIKFLDLLGVAPEPAHPALTELTFKLDKLDNPDDALVVPVPLATKVSVDDPDLTQEVVFETDRTLLALNAQIGVAITGRGVNGMSKELVTSYTKELTWLHSFAPFDPASSVGSTFYLGLLLRPIRSQAADKYNNDRLPAGPLDIYVEAAQVFDTDPSGNVIEGPLSTSCQNGSVPFTPRIEWQLFTGSNDQPDLFTDLGNNGWQLLSLSSDTTRNLSRSGHLVFEIPAGAEPVSPASLSPAFWQAFGEEKPPVNKAELIAALNGANGAVILEGLADMWEDLGVVDPADTAALAACSESVGDTIAKITPMTLKVDALSLADWKTIDPSFAVDLPVEKDRFRDLYWIRGRIKSAFLDDDPKPETINGLHLNTVPATQAATRLDDSLGRSTGRPAQRFTLPKTPVLIDPLGQKPDLTLTVITAGASKVWERVEDFYQSKPDSIHYRLDPQSGEVTFGDGRRGQIPVADAQVVASRYRVGGGDIGNVAAGTVSKIKGRIRGVSGVENIRAAHDGSDAETMENVKLRAPHDLRNLKRAVSAEDFADIAVQTPGVKIHRAYAIARRAIAENGTMITKDGAVTLVVLPNNKGLKPQPSEAQLREICEWMEPRRLITTELHIIGPQYSDITGLQLRISVRAGFDLTAVSEGVYKALLDFLNPITGGSDGGGWPMGDDIFIADLYEQVLDVDGVRRASALQIAVEGVSPDWTDVIALPEGHLPALTRDVISLVASYD
ncbi:MAG: putative baseplate assembly protein [Allorhizobium sp.]